MQRQPRNAPAGAEWHASDLATVMRSSVPEEAYANLTTKVRTRGPNRIGPGVRLKHERPQSDGSAEAVRHGPLS
jgi:hypothetical protein